MDIKTIPKLDLHCHLDGSLTKAMMERHLGKTIPEDALTVSEDCRSLTEYLEKFDLPVQCLQDEAGLEDGAYTFVEEIAKEHVEYIEVRFAPMLSVHENLSCAKVIEAVRKGMERAKTDFQVQYGIIVCGIRMEGLSAAPVCGCWNKGQYQHGQPNGQRYDHDKRTDESLRTVWAG